MSKFFRGERVILTSEVVFLDDFEYNDRKFARVAFEDKPFSFLINLSALSKKPICSTAPFPECNNGEGCDTCKHKEY